MFNVLPTYLSLLIAFMLGYLIIQLYNFKRSMPDVEQVLVDVGGDISEKLAEIFKDAPVKRAMGILGSKSGEVRADNALKKRVAGQAIDQIPGIGLILKQFDLTPIEGLKLLNDPLLGPLIQRGIAAAQKGLGGALGSFNNPGGGAPHSYGREE